MFYVSGCFARMHTRVPLGAQGPQRPKEGFRTLGLGNWLLRAHEGAGS